MKCVFLVDGFNLYHSLKQAECISRSQTKWLNIKALCGSLLQNIAQATGSNIDLQGIEYFSAPPVFRSAPTQQRYQLYIKAIESTGVKTIMGRFKAKDVFCPLCKNRYKAHEEKETDVSIAIRLVEISMKPDCDVVAVMSGDTDLAPAIRMCHRLFPAVRVICAFPYRRKNSELANLCPGSFAIKLKSCLLQQFPNPLVLPDGTVLDKPASW
jgi:uncharacterized LabA/DUF88 family protein